MCLAIPGKILELTGDEDDLNREGVVSFGNLKKTINLSMVPEASLGDYVICHVGVAISVVNEIQAKKIFRLLDEVELAHEIR